MADKLKETLISQINSGELSQSKQGTKRKSSSLSVVTKQFVEQIRREKDMTICLNDAMKKMNLKKRRLYDIANVLEGIGYVRKDVRNHLKWIGGGEDPQKTVQLHFLKDYFKQLREKEHQINQQIQNAHANLLNIIKENQHQQNFMTVSMEDCQKIRSHFNQQNHKDQYSMLIFQVPKETRIWTSFQKDSGLYNVEMQLAEGQFNSYLIEPGQNIRKCNQLDF